MQAKVHDWLDAGCRAVWLVDPATRIISVYRSKVEAELLSGDNVLSAPEIIPGFELKVSELFDVLAGGGDDA